jgi:hypothetical protein
VFPSQYDDPPPLNSPHVVKIQLSPDGYSHAKPHDVSLSQVDSQSGSRDGAAASAHCPDVVRMPTNTTPQIH